jgi:hypothetical protein
MKYKNSNVWPDVAVQKKILTYVHQLLCNTASNFV